MDRRTLLLALTATAASMTAAAPRVFAANAAAPAPPPPPPDDTFGFASTLRAEGVGGPLMRDFSGWVRALKTLGEAPMLTADAVADGGPSYRLTVLNPKAPAITAHVTWAANRQNATAMISYGDVAGMPGQRTRTVRRDYVGPAALSLLDIVDRLETFWDAAPLPPDWAAIQALADCPTCAVTEPEEAQMLLEARMGARRHLILRLAPPPSTLIARFAAAVIPAEPKPEPPKPAHQPRRLRHRPHRKAHARKH